MKLMKLMCFAIGCFAFLSVTVTAFGSEDICAKHKASAATMEKEIKALLKGINVSCGCPKSEPWKYPVACAIKCSGNDPRILHDYQAIGRDIATHFSRKTNFNYIIQVENELMPIAIFFYTIQFDRIDEIYPWR
jgi:hypothetical protein